MRKGLGMSVIAQKIAYASAEGQVAAYERSGLRSYDRLLSSSSLRDQAHEALCALSSDCPQKPFYPLVIVFEEIEHSDEQALNIYWGFSFRPL